MLVIKYLFFVKYLIKILHIVSAFADENMRQANSTEADSRKIFRLPKPLELTELSLTHLNNILTFQMQSNNLFVTLQPDFRFCEIK